MIDKLKDGKTASSASVIRFDYYPLEYETQKGKKIASLIKNILAINSFIIEKLKNTEAFGPLYSGKLSANKARTSFTQLNLTPTYSNNIIKSLCHFCSRDDTDCF